MTWHVNRREERAPREREPAPEEPLGKTSGFSLLVRDRYLLLIAGLMFIINWVNTTGEYVLDRTLLASAADAAARAGITTQRFVGTFKAEYFQWVNVIGVVMQLFVVSRIIKYLGVRRALFIMPVVSLAGYSVLAIVPQLSLIFAAKVAENSPTIPYKHRPPRYLACVAGGEYIEDRSSTHFSCAGDVMSAVVVD
jgi:AAA family ATP:ADP antiporter